MAHFHGGAALDVFLLLTMYRYLGHSILFLGGENGAQHVIWCYPTDFCRLWNAHCPSLVTTMPFVHVLMFATSRAHCDVRLRLENNETHLALLPQLITGGVLRAPASLGRWQCA